MTAVSSTAPDVQAVIAGRRRRARRRTVVVIVLAAVVAALFATSIMVGSTFYGPDVIIRVLLGEQVPGASFSIADRRLPRAAMAVLVGVAFGMAGATFQTLLRNPLASPDIIGVSFGASAAAVIGIVFFSVSGLALSALALGGALATALAIYLLSIRGGFAGTRLILIGIGLAAMLQSIVTYALSRAAAWDLQSAMRWLTGSLNSASAESLTPLALAAVVLVPLLALQSRSLHALRIGDDVAAALGVKVDRTRLALILGAVALLAFATAAAGPIAFVAFMAGPIAARLVGPGSSPLVPAGLVGAVLVLAADLVGQYALPTVYPVGVITGILGAPYLIALLIRTNRTGGSL